MKIGFAVEVDAIVGGRYLFVIDTDRFPYSIGNREVALKDFEIMERDLS